MGDLLSSLFETSKPQPQGQSGGAGSKSFSSLLFRERRISGRQDFGQATGLRFAQHAIRNADKITVAKDRARRRAGEVVPTRNQGAIAASVNTPGEAQNLIDRLNAGGATPRSKLTLEEQQEVIARKKKERGERESSERGATLSRAAAGALQSLFTRDTDIPEEVFSATTLGKQVVLGGGLRA